jgi:hypothetical protein
MKVEPEIGEYGADKVECGKAYDQVAQIFFK